jgi:dolichol-phosphate mannosyltransferase
MNKVMRLLYHMLMGVHLDDPLSGIFGIPDPCVEHCLGVEGDGYAYSTALTMSFEKTGFLQVPIAYSVMDPKAEAKFKKGWDTVRILFTIFRKFILYSITSVAASILDVILFGIFTSVTFKGNSLAIIYGTVLARLISASVNYLLTKNFVFHFKSDAAQTQARSAGMFMALSAVQCALSALSVSILNFVLGGNLVGIKVLVDTVLFFVSYKLQHKYIFKDDRKKGSGSAGTESDMESGSGEMVSSKVQSDS